MTSAPVSEAVSRNALVDGDGSPTSGGHPVLRADLMRFARALERAFGQSFAIVDSSSGEVTQRAVGGLATDLMPRLATCAEVVRRGRPDIVDEVAPLLMLAVPMPVIADEPPLVAISTFVTSRVEHEVQIKAAAHEFGVPAAEVLDWARGRTVWHPHAVLELSLALVEKVASQQQATQLRRQLADLSAHLLSTFEEITLVHRLTEHLSLTSSVAELCEMAVAWLADVVPAECVAIKLDAAEELQDPAGPTTESEVKAKSLLISHGTCPLDERQFDALMESLGPRARTEPLVINRATTGTTPWSNPDICELISVPIREGDHFFGWFVALNHAGEGETNSEAEFGTVEASLLSSVAVILGIHRGNIALYRQQAAFFASVVRALTSAIDAKDPYTCGHSDRVARLAVCLARRMGCGQGQLNTIYLSGLLHDIGKIGINDAVLRKPGPLTEAELEHIKTHPELGYRILDGVKELDQVLPIVLHHHEAWDGSGYPHGLKGEESPLMARIVAVADSIDAMSSDRPYRPGIPADNVDKILRDGAGTQWDPHVINAVFQVRDELQRIGQNERQPLSLDVEKWQTQTPIKP